MRDSVAEVDVVVDPAEYRASFRLMSNILDLASAVGNAAQALRDAGVPECRPMAQADAFVHAVKSLPGIISYGRWPEHYTPDMRSLEGWKAHQAQALEIARHLHVGLWELPEAERGEPVEHLTRLATRIGDGERLAARGLGSSGHA